MPRMMDPTAEEGTPPVPRARDCLAGSRAPCRARSDRHAAAPDTGEDDVEEEDLVACKPYREALHACVDAQVAAERLTPAGAYARKSIIGDPTVTMEQLQELCREENIEVVEDAAGETAVPGIGGVVVPTPEEEDLACKPYREALYACVGAQVAAERLAPAGACARKSIIGDPTVTMEQLQELCREENIDIDAPTSQAAVPAPPPPVDAEEEAGQSRIDVGRTRDMSLQPEPPTPEPTPEPTSVPASVALAPAVSGTGRAGKLTTDRTTSDRDHTEPMTPTAPTATSPMGR